MKIKDFTIKLFLLALLPAGIIFNAQAKNNRKAPNIAISIAANNSDNQKINHFNIGLMSNYQYLNGISINLLSDVAKYSTKGLQLSGLLNISGYTSNTAQIAGLANVTGYKANGLRLGGLMNISGNSSNGVQISGLGNISGKVQNGVAISGLINMSSKESTGLLIAGLANISGEKQNGTSLSGLLNVVGGDMKGLQLTSLLNITGKANYGCQFSAIGNVSVENKGLQIGIISNYCSINNGVQIGISNISGKPSRSLQLGLLNISNDSCNTSRQVGLVNIKPHTRTQLIISSGNINNASIAARFKNKMIYTQLGVGIIGSKITDNPSLSATYRTGLCFPIINNKLNINTDIGYSHIETLKNKNIPDRLYSIHPRMELEYSFSNKLGMFVSGGYSWTRTYKGNSSFSKDSLFEIGIILF